MRGDRAKHANSTHVEPRLKTFTYGGHLRAAFGQTGSASRCMMYTRYDREETEGGVQCGFGRGWGVEAVVAGLRALRAPSRYPRVLRRGLRKLWLL